MSECVSTKLLCIIENNTNNVTSRSTLQYGHSQYNMVIHKQEVTCVLLPV